jgi:hypothetical protein
MAPSVYDEKFLTGMHLLFKTPPFTMGEDKNLEHLTQELEEWHTMTIDFDFPRGCKNSATTFQATIRQPVTIGLIDSPVRSAIKTRSPRLILGEIRTMKPKKSAWSDVAIENDQFL